jgi:tRNA (guanine37-N1)-methyltransferase
MAMRLKDALSGVLNDEELQVLVGSYDVLGDIAVIIIPEVLLAREKLIADAILTNNPRIKVVAKRAGLYGGEFRTISLTLLAGEKRKETELLESGVRLRLNPERVYFSVRSGNERRRIASLVTPGEAVLVLFSGIAPYPLVISRFSKARTIVGIEKNPDAHDYALQNLQLNKKLCNIEILFGDAATLISSSNRRFDRIIMPHPTMAESFLPGALRVLKPGGYLHFYDLQRQGCFSDSVRKITTACIAANRQVVRAAIVKCGHCGPRMYRLCIDAMVQ